MKRLCPSGLQACGLSSLLYTDQTVTRGFSYLKSKRQGSRILLWHPCAFSPHPSRPLCLLAGPASRQVRASLSIFVARISQDPSWAASRITASRSVGFCLRENGSAGNPPKSPARNTECVQLLKFWPRRTKEASQGSSLGTGRGGGSWGLCLSHSYLEEHDWLQRGERLWSRQTRHLVLFAAHAEYHQLWM